VRRTPPAPAAGSLTATASVAVLLVAGLASTRPAKANGGGGGGAGESGTATHQHLDSRFSHDRYYYDRGYAVHRPPAGGVAEDLMGPNGERYHFQGGNWYRWRGEWYRCWGGAWVVIDAPLGVFVPALPPYYTTIWRSGIPYYYANDTFYVRDTARNGYQVITPQGEPQRRSK